MLNIIAGIILVLVLTVEGFGIIQAVTIPDGKLVLAYSLAMFLTLCFSILLGRGSK